MGVKGLWKKVHATHATKGLELFKERIPRGSTLLVDGYGLMFHLLDTQVQTMYNKVNPPYEHIYGGNYPDFHHVLVLELDRLMHTLGLHLVVFFDGESSFFKGDTAAKRYSHRLEEWRNWRDVVERNVVSRKASELSLPMPPLVKEEFLFVLRERHVDVVHCPMEADQDLAKECVRRNRLHPHQRCFVYSPDSDFLVMRDCPLIAIGGLDTFTAEYFAANTAFESEAEAETHVWTRERVAELLSMAPNQFVEWSIQQGNDFTGPFVDEKNTDCEDFQLATQYSRAFYELEDLDVFHQMEGYHTKPSPEDVLKLEFETGSKLLPAQKEFIENWVNKNKRKLKTEKQWSPKIISSFFRDYQKTLPADNHSSDSTTNSNKNSNDSNRSEPLFPLLKAHHFQALQDMRANLARYKDTLNRKRVLLTWENVCAANSFQKIISKLARCLSAHIDVSSMQPSTFFHAKLFHFYANKKEATMAKKEAQTQAQPTATSPSSTDDKASSAEKEAVPSSVTPVPSVPAVPSLATPVPVPVPAVPVTTAPASSTTPAPAPNSKKQKESATSRSPLLPVDSHRETILETVRRDRVTIIHGETGCGKSSKIPLFLLEDAEQRKEKCTIMIAQPRRIAVLNLRNRLREFLGDKVGLRMGHGVREGADDAKIIFVTTGYLVQLLAHSPIALRSITHLIVDEVHERSVDGDLLCWLTKRYLQSNLSLKVLLMSATLHTQLYQTYFTHGKHPVPQCLSVGVRRFPANILHVDEMLESPSLPHRLRRTCEDVKRECERVRGREIPANLCKNQYALAVELIRTKAREGTGALVFVSGLADIIELQARFEDMPRYRCVAIHSEIPFEEQEIALQPAAENEVKVIIATNAAESSVTLPDVDLVICLGTHKSINYRQGDLMRSTLTNTWISKSSAVQRAGRTGRVRPGEVYRLYTQKIYSELDEHQQAEIHCKPLHEIILTLKSIFQDNDEHVDVTDILSQLLEPPDLSRIQDCFDLLYESNMISAPMDDSKLTSHGAFAGRMPVDLSLSKLIIYGISLGLGAEAVVLANALAQPKTLFRIASPLVHSDPDEYNEIVRTTFYGMFCFDNGAYSEPLMMLQLFIVWRTMSATASLYEKRKFLDQFGLVAMRVNQFVSSTQHLLKTVNECKGKACPELTFNKLQDNLNAATLNKLRLVLLWALEFNLMRSCDPAPPTQPNTLTVKKDALSKGSFLAQFPAPFDTLVKWRRDEFKWVSTLPLDRSLTRTELPRLLRALCVHAREGDTEAEAYIEQAMAVLRIKKQITEEEEEQEQQGKGKKKKKGEAAKESKEKNKKKKKKAKIVTLFTICFAIDKSDSSSLSPLLSLAQSLVPSFAIHRLSEYDCAHLAMFALETEDEAVMKKLSSFALQDLQHCGLSLFATEEREAKLITMNFIPSHEITLAFFPDRALHLPRNAEIAKKVDKAIDKAVVSRSNTFSVDFEDRSLFAEAPPSLFKDLSPGMRLFNAYCLGYKDKKMRIRAGADEKESSAALVPGSREWLQQKEQEAKREEGIEDSLKDIVVVPAKPLVSKWRVCSGFQPESSLYDGETGAHLSQNVMFDPTDWSTVMLSSRSILATSRYLQDPTDPKACLFGVSFYAMAFGGAGQGNNNRTVACEGVTFFPPDMTWVLRGLLCIGRRLSIDSEMELDMLSGCLDGAPSKFVSTKCRTIRMLLAKSKGGAFKPQPALIKAVNELFDDYHQGR